MKTLISKQTYTLASQYLDHLRKDANLAGYKLRSALIGHDLARLAVDEFLGILVNTKRPRIFAESEIKGSGIDWHEMELTILGDISMAMQVRVYDTGLHYNPVPHQIPIDATLVFMPGALLISKMPDYKRVTIWTGHLDYNAFYSLYKNRLLPVFRYINATTERAIVTIPGIGCGCFAGRFHGRIGEVLKSTLVSFLAEYGADFPNIKAIYYDPYNECKNETLEIHGITFMVRPFLAGNHKPQLCKPGNYGIEYADCDLYSIVAWDHVSWPGNDFYAGCRATDDGVKAAATDSMFRITGHKGHYDGLSYWPLTERTWLDIIKRHNLKLNVDILIDGENDGNDS